MTVADQEQLAILKQGVHVWNKWRQENSDIDIDLRIALLGGRNLSQANLSNANLNEADFFKGDLTKADLSGADLRKANLSGASLHHANLIGADLSKADLSKAGLHGAFLGGANLIGANLHDADLSGASLLNTNLARSVLTDCNIYGISAWDLKLEGAEQSNLVITRSYQPTVTVSNMKVAQFLYMLINNPEIRDVLDTITSKVVLILGRFTDEQLEILEALRTELQKWDYIPVLFDFDAPKSRDVEETVSTLAHMARFIIADITDPKAIPQELSSIVKNLQSVPVLPLLHKSQEPWGMFASIKRRPTVLPILEYSTESELIGKIL